MSSYLIWKCPLCWITLTEHFICPKCCEQYTEDELAELRSCEREYEWEGDNKHEH